MAGLADVGMAMYRKTTIRLTQPEAKELADVFFKALKECITKDGKVTVKGFGAFIYKHKPARECRNPRNGEMVMSVPKNVIVFKQAKVEAPKKPAAPVKKANRKK